MVRLLLFVGFFFFSSFFAIAAPVMPIISTASSQTYYTISFARLSAYCLKDNGYDALIVESTFPSPITSATPEQKWRFESDGSSGYYVISQTGRRMTYNGAYFVSGPIGNSFSFVATTNTTYPNKWELSRVSSKAINELAGSSICEYGANDGGNPLILNLVETITVTNKVVLLERINVAALFKNNAVVGVSPGLISQSAKDNFSSAISLAQSVYNNSAATSVEVDNAIVALNSAFNTFKNSVNTPINSTTQGSDVWYYIKSQRGSSSTGLWLTAQSDNSKIQNLDLVFSNAQKWKVVTNGSGVALINKAYGTYMNANVANNSSVGTTASMPSVPLAIASSIATVNYSGLLMMVNALSPNTFRLHAGLPAYGLLNWYGNIDDNCSFLFVPVSECPEVSTVGSEKWYLVKNAGRTSRQYLSDNNIGSQATGENLTVNNDRFLWKIVSDGAGKYMLVGKANSGQIIAPSRSNNTNIGSTDQKYTLSLLGAGKTGVNQYSFYASTNQYMHLDGYSNIVGWDASADGGSAWMFIDANGLPSAPTNVTAEAGDTQALITFTASIGATTLGSASIINYTVTSSPAGITATSTSSPILISGLTNGVSYTFTVAANTSVGTGATSSPSPAITPVKNPFDFSTSAAPKWYYIQGADVANTSEYFYNKAITLSSDADLTWSTPSVLAGKLFRFEQLPNSLKFRVVNLLMPSGEMLSSASPILYGNSVNTAWALEFLSGAQGTQYRLSSNGLILHMQESESNLVSWGAGYNSASVFKFTSVNQSTADLAVSNSLTALISECQTALNATQAGTNPGQYLVVDRTNFQAAITSATAISNNAGATLSEKMQAISNLISAKNTFVSLVITIKPSVVGGAYTYYYITSTNSTYSLNNVMVDNASGTNKINWTTKDRSTKKLWCFIAGTGDSLAIQNMASQKYISKVNGWSTVFLGSTAKNFKMLFLGAGQLSINAWGVPPLHAAQSGAEVVSWSGGLNSASSWKLEEYPTVSTASATYYTAQSVPVVYSSSTSTTDWISIKLATDGAPTAGSKGTWYYCNSGTQTPGAIVQPFGSVTYPAQTFAAGSYIVYYMASDGYTVLFQQPLTILELTSPIASLATSLTKASFVANWSAVSGATGYFLDISKDASFSTLLAGYNNLSVGNVTSYFVSGLDSVCNYYYRLRTTNGVVNSVNSNTANAFTLGVLRITNMQNTDALSNLAGVDVLVQAGGTLNVNALKMIKNLTVEPNGKVKLTAPLTVADVTLKADVNHSFNMYVNSNSTVKGVVKYQRTIDDTKWYFMSFPCNVAVNDILLSGGGILNTDFVIKRYDGQHRATYANTAGTNWVTVSAGSTLNAYQGYIFGLTSNTGASRTLTFPLQKSLVESESASSIPVIFYNGSLGPNNKGWNLVGQPYLSAISGASVNVNYITKHNGTTYEARSNVDVTGINPFEAFFVQVGNSTPIDFGLSGRQMQKSIFNISSDVTHVALNITNENSNDQTNLILNDQLTLAYDIGDDLEKWIVTGTVKPQIYTVLAGVNYAFNTLPYESVRELPLGYYTKTKGSVTIHAFVQSTSLLSQLLLRDYVTGAVTDLLFSDYTFTSDAGTYNGRFSITASRIATNNTVTSKNATPMLIIKNANLYVLNIQSESKVDVYEITGRIIYSGVVKNNILQIPLQSKGIYFVQFTSGTDKCCKKIVFN